MPFETVTVGYTREWYVGEIDDDTAFEYAWKKVEEWCRSFTERPEIKLKAEQKRRGLRISYRELKVFPYLISIIEPKIIESHIEN